MEAGSIQIILSRPLRGSQLQLSLELEDEQLGDWDDVFHRGRTTNSYCKTSRLNVAVATSKRFLH